MPRSLSTTLALVLALGAGLVFASCGEEDAQLLPGETAREITANLNAVQDLADEGDCIGAEAAAEQVSEQIDELSGVDARLKQVLEDGAARLNEVIVECEESSTEAIAPATIPEEVEEEERGRSGDNNKGKEADKGTAQPQPETSPSLPPQAEGEAKGRGNGDSQGQSGGEEAESGGEEEQSGGVGPGSPAGEGE